MPDLLTRRNGFWHFVRCVPAALAHLDPRSVVRHSTRIRIAEDRNGRRAAQVAMRLNEQLELTWKGLLGGQNGTALSSYDQVRLRAKTLGYDYLELEQILARPTEALVERLETLLLKNVENDQKSRAASLGTEKRPAFMLSELFEAYELSIRDEIRDFSPDQLRIWRNGRIRAVVAKTGDKPVADLT